MRKTRGHGTLISVKSGRVCCWDIDVCVNHANLVSYGELMFIVNDNVHKTSRRSRGTLITTYQDIGYIIKACGSHAVYQPLQPREGEMRLISLYNPNNLPLQQVGGPLLLDPSKACVCQVDKDGNVVKSTDGPDTIYCKSSSIPEHLERKLQNYQFDQEEDYQETPNKFKWPNKVPVIYVLCSDSTRRSVYKGKDARRFSVPYGEKSPRCLCKFFPQKKFHKYVSNVVSF